MQNQESTVFGTRTVSPDEKTRLVRGVFDGVASQYDLMNDLMSGGVHRLWKRRFIREIRPRRGLKYLDVAGGTGDIAFLLRERLGKDADITLCDLTPDMLSVGRDRALDRGFASGLNWSAGNAESLPFPDNSFDVYTIAFGLRNVTHIDTALSEAYRVLRPGGRFYCLEFSHPPDAGFARLYDAYSYGIIPKLGAMVAKDKDSYQYLVDSIRAFPKQAQLTHRLEQAGFAKTGWTDLSFGIVAIHKGTKI